jgi:Uma2 family endonuclease
MGFPQEKSPFSAEEYLDWESAQPEKHEYVAGEVYAMVGVRRVHAIVAGNLFVKLREHLRGTPCQPFISDLKLSVPSLNAFYYPDVMVTCHEADRVAEFYIEHPKLIIEILSDSTAAYDRGAKFSAYRNIDSLEEYVLVDIDRKGVENFRRQVDGQWLLRDYALAENCVFESVGMTMSMASVFEDV